MDLKNFAIGVLHNVKEFVQPALDELCGRVDAVEQRCMNAASDNSAKLKYIDQLVDKRLREFEAEHNRMLAIVETVSKGVLRYKGVWESGVVYKEGNAVTYDGSTWVCMVEQTTQTPGKSRDFQLACKRGRDGRDR